MEANIPKGPTLLAISRHRDAVYAAHDIIEWVKKSSGREDDNDPQSYKEITLMHEVLKLQSCGDGVLFGRDAAKELVWSEFFLKKR